MWQVHPMGPRAQRISITLCTAWAMTSQGTGSAPVGTVVTPSSGWRSMGSPGLDSPCKLQPFPGQQLTVWLPVQRQQLAVGAASAGQQAADHAPPAPGQHQRQPGAQHRRRSCPSSRLQPAHHPRHLHRQQPHQRGVQLQTSPNTLCHVYKFNLGITEPQALCASKFSIWVTFTASKPRQCSDGLTHEGRDCGGVYQSCLSCQCNAELLVAPASVLHTSAPT